MLNKYFGIYNYGNELEQLRRYNTLVDILDRPAVKITAELRDKYDISIEKYIKAPLKEFYSYRYDLYAEEHPNKQYTSEEGPSIWNRTYISMENNQSVKYGQDCQYKVADDAYVIKYIENQNNFFLTFDIVQSQCKQSLIWTSLNITNKVLAETLFQGGSSFDIFWETQNYLSACTSIDHFNFSYSIYCPIKYHHQLAAGKIDRECGNISVILQYEHYDAYDNKGIQKFILLNEKVVQDTVCAIIKVPYSFSYQLMTAYPIFLGQLVSSRNVSDESTKPSDQYKQHMWTTSHSILTSPVLSTNASYRYMWNSKGLTYITHEVFRVCLQNKNFDLVGSSHMRYLYDFLYNSYVKKFDLYIHHADHSSKVGQGKISYIHKTFGAHVANYFENLKCDSRRRKVIIVQTLTWDLKYFPVVNFIYDPKNGQSIIKAIEKIKSMEECNDSVVILWLTCMPHPLCKDRDCGLGLNYWRNNAALKAGNQYLIEELTKVGYKNLKILDVMPIILPRLLKWDNDVLYFNHFLFSGFETTPQGIAMVMELLHDLCDEEVLGVSRSIDPSIGMSSNPSLHRTGFDKAEELFAVPRKTSNQGIDGLRYFRWSFLTGCYREIPDNVTISYLGYNIDQFHELSSEKILSQYTPCHIPLYPSRKNGSMWQIHGDRHVYYLDSGKRRPMNSVQTLQSLGRDFDETFFCTLDEMNSVPIGDVLYGKEGVNFMKHLGS